MGTIKLQLRTDKTDKQGIAPIRIIYQISGERRYFPTTVNCLPANWDASNQQLMFINKKKANKLAPNTDYELFLTEAQVKELNLKLKGYISDISDVEKRFSLDKVVYTPRMVVEALSHLRKPESKKEEPRINIVAFINQFIKESVTTHKPGTLKVYSGLAVHLADFEQLSGFKASFDKIDLSFFRAFHSYLSSSKCYIKKDGTKGSKAMNNITSAKQISTLKTLLNYARTIYKINVHPDYRDYKVTRKDSDFEVITLNNDEFYALYNLDLSGNKKLAQVRDVFCFSCATGLRYSDLAQLKREHIRNDAIKMTATKTGQRLEIPLNTISVEILERYKEMHRPIPIISNQKTNDYLKELCKKAAIATPIEIIREYGIRKVATTYKKYELVSIHTGRKTFSTLSLERGMATQEVMAITGHSTFKAFKRYVDVTINRKKAVMALAWGGIPEKNLKAV